MARNSSKSTQKDPKPRSLYTPKPVQDRVVAGHIAGKSARAIAKQEEIHPRTVHQILGLPEIQELIAESRQKLLSLIPNAIEVLKAALSSENERIRILAATKLMDSLRVIPREVTDFVLPQPQKEGLKEMYVQIAEMMIEKNKTFGTPLPPDVEEIKAKVEAQFSENSKSSGDSNPPAIPEI